VAVVGVMMSTSNVNDPSHKHDRRVEDPAAGAGFQTFDSLWKEGEGTVSTIASEQVHKEQLRKEAESIVSGAEARAASIEQDAHDKGYEKGFAEGLEKGEQKGRNDAAEKTAKLENLLQMINQERKSLYGQYEHDVVELVKMIVDKLVDHEVSVNPKVILACLKTSLNYVIENSVVKVHLNGNDFTRIREAGFEDLELIEGFNQLELIEDQSVSEGGCLLETEFGEVDATLENRKEKIVEIIDKSFLKGLGEV
jgi:flagellar assembly protein FliH